MIRNESGNEPLSVSIPGAVRWAIPCARIATGTQSGSAKGERSRAVELYDHQNDPQENTNLGVLPQYNDLVKRFGEQLHQGWRAVRPSPSVVSRMCNWQQLLLVTHYFGVNSEKGESEAMGLAARSLGIQCRRRGGPDC